MKKRYLILIILFALSINALEKKPWTVLTYMAGDNSLGDFVDRDLAEMQAGVTPYMHSLAFVNTHKQGYQKTAQRIIVKKEGLYQDGQNLINVDSGKAQTAIDAGFWAIENYPSEKFVFIFWNHGSGPLNPAKNRGICFDDTTGNYFNEFDIHQILSAIQKKLGRNIDIVACDACLMAGIELAHNIKSYANFYVSSQETIPGDGYQYQYFFNALNYDIDAKSLAYKMVTAYDKCYYSGTSDYTLSAVDLNKVDPLIDNVNQLSIALLNALYSQSRYLVLQAIKKAAFSNPNIRFHEKDYIDLYSFYSQLYYDIYYLNIAQNQKIEILNILRAGMYFLKQAVFSTASSPKYASVKGLSIYLPQGEIHESYEQLLWAQNTRWIDLLRALQ